MQDKLVVKKRRHGTPCLYNIRAYCNTPLQFRNHRNEV